MAAGLLRSPLITYPVVAVGVLVAVGGVQQGADAARYVSKVYGSTVGILTTAVPPTMVDSFREGQRAGQTGTPQQQQPDPAGTAPIRAGG